MSRHYAVSPNGLDAIYGLVQAAMDGTGRVGAEELAVVLAEHEPQRFRQEPHELSDSQYESMFVARFGHTVHEAAPKTGEDEYQLQFAQRFGFEASS